jgi:Trk K+ transport system NAD-binding subunit
VVALVDVTPTSPLLGRTPNEVKAATGCAVVATARTGAAWRHDPPDDPLPAGGRALVGGLLLDVLRVARDTNRPPVVRHSRDRDGEEDAITTGIRRTLLPLSAAAFVAVVLVGAVVYGVAFDETPVNALHIAMTMAMGDAGPDGKSTAVAVFAILSTLAGVFLAAVLFSYVAARVLEERLEERMGRRARRQRDHVIVAGLGRVGYRVVGLLRDLDVPVVGIEEQAESPFRSAVADTTPVLTGNARLVENLERAGVRQARALVACTDDDLTNLAACLEARRCHGTVTTVARVGDDELADRLGPAFGLDLVASTTRVAASAFIAAATDGSARRAVAVDELCLVAGRLDVDARIPRDQLEAWRGAGLRVLAREDRDGSVSPPSSAIGRDLETGERVLVIAPPAVFEQATVAASDVGAGAS